MSDIEVYVQSSGFSPDQDYSWMTYKEGTYRLEKPSYLNELTFLIQSEAFSLALALYKDDIVLLVTGLKGGERKDFHGRQIRNSILWKSKREYKELFRYLSVNILQDWRNEDKEFIESISASVEEYNPNISDLTENSQNVIKNAGFTFNYERLVSCIKEKNKIQSELFRECFKEREKDFDKKMIARYIPFPEITEKTLFKLNDKIEKNKLDRIKSLKDKVFIINDEIEKSFNKQEIDLILYHSQDQNPRLKELIYDLHNVPDLPEGPVVVFTDKKSQGKILQVWRALSSLVESQNWIKENKEIYEHVSVNLVKVVRERCKKEVKKFVKNPLECVNKYGEYVSNKMDKIDVLINKLEGNKFCRAKRFLNTQEKKEEFQKKQPVLYQRLEPLLDKLNGKRQTPVNDLLRKEKNFNFDERKAIWNHFSE
ncbi:MAG TPA: hypothetical protein PL110_10830 [Candidatus Eremiobacteraeota bacterium]|nr:hypothetical protein [Candidatus Eremiobacteraeota bacterium]